MRQSKVRTLKTAQKYEKLIQSGRKFKFGKLVKEWKYHKLCENPNPHDNLPYKVNHVIWSKYTDDQWRKMSLARTFFSGSKVTKDDLIKEWILEVLPYLQKHYSVLTDTFKKSVPDRWHRQVYAKSQYWSKKDLQGK